jgi:hypothetical protein
MDGRNTCSCPTPPGGIVVCPPDEAAICWVNEAGELTAGCMHLPPAVAGSLGRFTGGSKEMAWLGANVTAAEDELERLLAEAISSYLSVRPGRFLAGKWTLEQSSGAVVATVLLSKLARHADSTVRIRIASPSIAVRSQEEVYAGDMLLRSPEFGENTAQQERRIEKGGQ